MNPLIQLPPLPPSAPMHSIDRAWLQMDRRHNPMLISGLFELEGKLRPAAARRVIVERLLRYPRFRQRPAADHSPPLWISEPEIALDYHAQIRRLPADGYDAALRRAVSAELTAEMDPCRPLWRLVVFACRGRPCTVFFRAHHALADGIAILHVLLECTDAAVRRQPKLQSAPPRWSRRGPLEPLIRRLEAANAALQLAADLVAEDLRHPQLLAEQLRAGRDALGAIGHVLSLPDDNPGQLGSSLSGHRVLAWVSGLPLDPLRHSARKLGVKINDLLMAAVAGACGNYLRAIGGEVAESQNLRVSIPVNLRDLQGAGELGNCFGLVLLDLPVGVSDPAARLSLVADRMNRLKTSGAARATLLGLAAVGHLPAAIERSVVERIAGKTRAVVSNLRGPRRCVKIGGARLRNLVFWPPQTGDVGLGISLMSYAGSLSLGISADGGVIRQPERLLSELRRALEEPGPSAGS